MEESTRAPKENRGKSGPDLCHTSFYDSHSTNPGYFEEEGP